MASTTCSCTDEYALADTLERAVNDLYWGRGIAFRAGRTHSWAVAALKDDRVRRKVQAWNAVANPQMPVPSTATWRAVEQICRERRERAERLHLVGGRS